MTEIKAPYLCNSVTVLKQKEVALFIINYLHAEPTSGPTLVKTACCLGSGATSLHPDKVYD
jgi:hypothetical protein